MRTIEIDFDIHKKIELERTSFEESPNAVLRRLLGLAKEPIAPTGAEEDPKTSWRDRDGLTLPHGTKLRMTYGGRTHEGAIERGTWLVEGQKFHSPSGAASVARTKKGQATKLNGWNYWEARLPGSTEWVNIMTLSVRQNAGQ